MVKSMQECPPELQKEQGKRVFCETASFFNHRDGYKRGFSQGLQGQTVLASLCSRSVQSPEEGRTEAAVRPLVPKCVSLKGLKRKEAFHFSMTTLVQGSNRFPGLKFPELSVSEKSFGWLAVFHCKDVF